MGRRELTTGITLLVLCGLVALGAVWGWRSLTAELPAAEPAAEPSEVCTTKQVDAGQRLRSSQVLVSVYNGGTRSGLADSTLNALRRRGFQTGNVGNAPSDAEVRKVQVWSTQRDDLEAKLVALQFGPGTPVLFADEDLGPGVDVVVGNDFRRLAQAKRWIKVREPQEVCVPNKEPRRRGQRANAAG
ncbi:MAG TPA: LytR C-terminal domain-containing protein [Nocardioidaceae bacterium]|jgi:hypothetical protein|nr:LytR C-terminal domain-containing protein [Nocardioidaceae bacterium]